MSAQHPHCNPRRTRNSDDGRLTKNIGRGQQGVGASVLRALHPITETDPALHSKVGHRRRQAALLAGGTTLVPLSLPTHSTTVVTPPATPPCACSLTPPSHSTPRLFTPLHAPPLTPLLPQVAPCSTLSLFWWLPKASHKAKGWGTGGARQTSPTTGSSLPAAQAEQVQLRLAHQQPRSAAALWATTSPMPPQLAGPPEDVPIGLVGLQACACTMLQAQMPGPSSTHNV